jgi:hypothetical protein
MNPMRRSLLTGLLCASALMGCGKDDAIVEPPVSSPSPTPRPLDTTVIVPLTVGNRWRYRQTIIGSTIPPTERVVEVLGDTLLRGQTWAVINGGISFHEHYPLYTSFYRRDADGVHEWGNYDNQAQWGQGFTPLFPYPVKVGDRLHQYLGGGRVLATDTSITVPAGTFRCYHYRHYMDSGFPGAVDMDFFFAPGVGLIRNDIYSGLRTVYEREELIEVILK